MQVEARTSLERDGSGHFRHHASLEGLEEDSPCNNSTVEVSLLCIGIHCIKVACLRNVRALTARP